MNNKQNRIIGAMLAIAATLSFPINRVMAAKIATKKALGHIPEGTGRYRGVCPKGAGHCAGHSMSERSLVGSRSFTRRQRRFIKSNYTLNKAVKA